MRMQCPNDWTHFIFILEGLMNKGFHLKSIVYNGGLSNHLPILFKLEMRGKTPPVPSKFNLVWLEEEEFK
jgi:hypothetical protein